MKHQEMVMDSSTVCTLLSVIEIPWRKWNQSALPGFHQIARPSSFRYVPGVTTNPRVLECMNQGIIVWGNSSELKI